MLILGGTGATVGYAAYASYGGGGEVGSGGGGATLVRTRGGSMEGLAGEGVCILP